MTPHGPPGDARARGAGQGLLLRPVQPQDGALLASMLRLQPAQLLRHRFHGAVRPSALWCERMSRVDHRRELALVICTAAPGGEQIVAEGRYFVGDDGLTAECALMVDARWQRHGLGRWLLCALTTAATERGLLQLECQLEHDNKPMLQLAAQCGFAAVAAEQGDQMLRMRSSLPARAVRTDRLGPLASMRPQSAPH